MLKGLAITPPVIGRISIGRVVERNGKRLPEKDDQFTLTSQVQSRDGWLLHPLDEKLRKGAEGQKLRSIPMRLLFNDPVLNLRADYSLFDRATGRPACVGTGHKVRKLNAVLQHPAFPYNGAFEELEEDVPAVAEEFYLAAEPVQRMGSAKESASSPRGRLEARVAAAQAD